MAPVGPQIPASLLDKRKRAENDDSNDSDSSSDSDTGPAPPKPPEESTTKRARVIGPSLPPPSSTDQYTAGSDKDSDSSEDEDDFGPSLPTTKTDPSAKSAALPSSNLDVPTVQTTTAKRDDWMIVPPAGGDWTARVDPTKLKNRKFNTGKSAKAPAPAGGDASNAWHETPQEKQARLQREMLGIKDSPAAATSASSKSDSIDPETAKRLEEYKKSRGPSLYAAHQNSEQIEKDDDPSARAFDREKDVGGGLQINATQRRDMLRKAADFNSRFSSAKYL